MEFAFGWDGMVEWLGTFDETTINTFLGELPSSVDWLRIACVEAIWHKPATFCRYCHDFVVGRAGVDCEQMDLDHHSNRHSRTKSGLLVSAPIGAPGNAAGTAAATSPTGS